MPCEEEKKERLIAITVNEAEQNEKVLEARRFKHLMAKFADTGGAGAAVSSVGMRLSHFLFQIFGLDHCCLRALRRVLESEGAKPAKGSWPGPRPNRSWFRRCLAVRSEGLP